MLLPTRRRAGADTKWLSGGRWLLKRHSTQLPHIRRGSSIQARVVGQSEDIDYARVTRKLTSRSFLNLSSSSTSICWQLLILREPLSEGRVAEDLADFRRLLMRMDQLSARRLWRCSVGKRRVESQNQGKVEKGIQRGVGPKTSHSHLPR